MMETNYRKLSLRELQLMQLEAMKDIHRVCQKRGIKYYIIAGTLLGSIRHGGFIPWDDDIDIAMMREEYEKFRIIFLEEFDLNNYFLQHYESDVDFRPELMRFCIKNTFSNNVAEMHWNNCKNTYIDIFPLDNVPDDKKLRKKQYVGIMHWKKLISLKLYRINSTDTFISLFVKKSLSFILRLIPLRLAHKKQEELMKKYDFKVTECVCSMASKYNFSKQCMNRRIYGKPTLVKFEDTEFYAPEMPTKYLEHLYGVNYMDIPSVEKRAVPEEVYIVKKKSL